MLSKNAHPVAALRKILDLRQKEFAALIGVATVTVQKIEIGKRKLTSDLAKRIEEQTGVQGKWLLAGDHMTVPSNCGGVPYRKLDYEKAQAGIRSPIPHGIAWTFKSSRLEMVQEKIIEESTNDLVQLHLGGALRKGRYEFNMLCFRIEQFLRTQSRLLKLDTVDDHGTMIAERQAEIDGKCQRPMWKKTTVRIPPGTPLKNDHVDLISDVPAGRRKKRKKK
jgi:transcriptional regulator with XRE-family HTH domain